MSTQIDDLEQHGRRDSLRIVGIPESDNDDTDSTVLKICSAIEVDPPVQPSDIAVSHRLGKKEAGKTRQVIVKFATRNVRERVYSSKKNPWKLWKKSLNIQTWAMFILMKIWQNSGRTWLMKLAPSEILAR